MATGMRLETDIGGTMDIGAVLLMKRRIGWRPIMMESDFSKAIGMASAAAATTTTTGITTVTATSIMITIASSLLARNL
jgi:hypothetical protein